ncbi:hypothetical protein L3Q82_015608 [Scortum barcoo]|uniref:Uncharacterized protein n=1 Tax=Scortum barcoo TaxID=214431 RepID=A0ACB8VRJ4_9TELE|nr:hypothetical protein L3Q82_015608 [Scortum barcoo]
MEAQAHFSRQEINSTVWEVPEKYTRLRQIGTGAYGSVCSAINERTKEKVAIKKLHRPFQSEIFAKRAYRELRLLKHMKHENVIGLLDVFTPASGLDDIQDFYLVMPYMFTDLSKVRGNLSEDKVQFLVYQMLCGLRVSKASPPFRNFNIDPAPTAHFLLQDLKPGNLAVNQDCELKMSVTYSAHIPNCDFASMQILDFGLARSTDAEMTGYVVTRWYRAPEVILNWMHYTQTGKTIVAVLTSVFAVVSVQSWPAGAVTVCCLSCENIPSPVRGMFFFQQWLVWYCMVDIWSVGCIMAEMINGKTLFKGKDYMDQLTQIMKVTGVPGPEFIQKLDSPEAKTYIRSLPRYPRKDFSTLFPRASAMGIDLLEKMLVLDGDERPTAELALEHPYFDSLRDPDDFPEPKPYDDSHDNATLSLDEWKSKWLCFKEVKSFVPFPRRDSKRKNTLTMSH